MQEFNTVSSSSYDPAALAAKLTEKSAEGWTVVSIVSTGGDVTAFISRESTGISTRVPVIEAAPAPEQAPAPEPTVVAEPAGWAVAPEPAPMPVAAEPAPVSAYPPAAQTYTPAPAPAPAPAAAAPVAAQAVPAGWYADPAARFELRYWDGGTWTEHVSRAGQQFTDPPVA